MLIPISPYEPRELFEQVHVNPADVVQAHTDMDAGRTVGVHYGTFQLGSESFEAPVQDLAAARIAAGLTEEDVSPCRFGVGVELQCAP